MTAIAQARQTRVWAWNLLLLGYTAWEVIVPLCSPGRELWPPPSGALLFVAFYGLPWLAAVAGLSMILHFLGSGIRVMLIAAAVAAFLTLTILILAGPFAQAHAWSAMRAERARTRLS